MAAVPKVALSARTAQDVREICRQGVSSWSLLEHGEIEVRTLEGGITNSMWTAKAKRPDLVPAQVVVRVFGSGGGVDRVAENLRYKVLSDQNISPPFLVEFLNGRVELFFQMKTLARTDLPDPEVHLAIARELAKLHRVKLAKGTGDNGSENGVWSCIDSWMNESQEIVRRLYFFEHDMVRLQADLKQLKLFIDEKYQSSPEVFCHNDLLAANILWDPDKKRIQFIDFEYGSFNPRGFDIGNHFAEWMGGTEVGTVDFSAYPTDSKQRSFCHAYLESLLDRSPSADEVEDLVKEANVFSLSTSSEVDFDYKLFSNNRIKAFYLFRDQFISSIEFSAAS